jgi:ABC-type uncharacterized transport system substrate-binding protein
VQTSVGGQLIRHFGPGIGLIAAASAVLLFSDSRWHHERRSPNDPKRVALINYVTVPVLEEGEAGMIAGLKDGGFADGQKLSLTRYIADGDRSTAIMIAKEVLNGDYDAVLTLSTPVLQAVAGVNVDVHRTHVFTLSTDPWGASVGISRDNPAQHPPYMTGQGTLQPVAGVFRLAREANPKLAKVGVVWNPAESNSEASTTMAREVSKQMQIELVEMTIDSSSAVLDAVKALLARDVQAIWAGGDATVAPAIETLIRTAAEAGVPVVSNNPSDVKKGALLSLGADYFEVGHAGGLLAARVLNGADPAKIPIENYAPEVLALNMVARQRFQAHWAFKPDWPKRAKLIIDRKGTHEGPPPAAPPKS